MTPRRRRGPDGLQAVFLALLLAAVRTAAEPGTWEKRAFGRLEFDVPSEWNALSVYSETNNFWFRGDIENPEASFTVTRVPDAAVILEGLNVESRRTTTVGRRIAERYDVSSRDVGGRGILVVFAEKEPDGSTLVLVGTFSDDAAQKKHGGVLDRILSSVRFKDGPNPKPA
jgi:hypothetical protein